MLTMWQLTPKKLLAIVADPRFVSIGIGEQVIIHMKARKHDRLSHDMIFHVEDNSKLLAFCESQGITIE